MPAPKNVVAVPYLRAWRLHALMTQDQLAEAADVGKATVVRAERDGTVSALTAAKIARALGITLKQLETTQPEGGA